MISDSCVWSTAPAIPLSTGKVAEVSSRSTIRRRGGTSRLEVLCPAFNLHGSTDLRGKSAAVFRSTSEEKQMKKTKILFLAANPMSPDPEDRLALDEEARDIEEKLVSVKHRDLFEFKTRWAVRPGDLHDALLREEPVVVHYSGHASGEPGLVLHGSTEGEERLVGAEALKHLFGVLKDNIRIVVLNACYSDREFGQRGKARIRSS